MALLQSLKVVGGYGTSAHPSEEQLEANSSTFEKGAVLRYNGSGRLAEAGVDPVDIVGVALEDGENGTSKECRFCPAMPGVIFSGQIDDGTLEKSAVEVCAQLKDGHTLYVNSYVVEALGGDSAYEWVGGLYVTVSDSLTGDELEGTPGLVTILSPGLDFNYVLEDVPLCK